MADEETSQRGITVKIVTPEGLVYDQNQAEIAVINTQGGQLGIMAGHEPIMAAMAIDELLVKKTGKKSPLPLTVG